MNSYNYAPVIIPTLNRFEHFKRCIESLSRCVLADKTEVYIGLDYPPADKYQEGYLKIKQYLDSCQDLGFKSLHVVLRKKNIGAVANWQSLQQMVLENHDTICCTEDDNEFSLNFLVYINKGLDKFKDNPNIYAICGYNFPIDMTGYENDFYYSNEMCAWGYATWKEKYQQVLCVVGKTEYLNKYYKEMPLAYLLSRKLRFLNNIMYFGKGVYEDVFVASYLHSHNLLTVVPKISKVRNWGHDGSGLNSTEISNGDIFSSQELDQEADFSFDSTVSLEVPFVLKARLDSFFGCGFPTKVRRLLMFLLLRLFLKLQN